MQPPSTIFSLMDQAEFLKRVEMTSSGCWDWLQSCSPSGYGRSWHEGKIWRANRLAWHLFRGPIPKGLRVCHKCDRPRCVNPDHLFLGTDADNIADRDAKGRHWVRSGDEHGIRRHPERAPHGERNGSAKLTRQQVVEIRSLVGTASHREIGRRFGISQQTTSRIISGELWRTVEM
jgi:HNH endonuclease